MSGTEANGDRGIADSWTGIEARKAECGLEAYRPNRAGDKPKSLIWAASEKHSEYVGDENVCP